MPAAARFGSRMICMTVNGLASRIEERSGWRNTTTPLGITVPLYLVGGLDRPGGWARPRPAGGLAQEPRLVG